MATKQLMRKSRSHSSRGLFTFLYGVTPPLIGSLVNENKLNIAVFKIGDNGQTLVLPLRYNPKAFDTGYAGTIKSLTASPDGRFLFMECSNTDDGNYRPHFLQYRILVNGQLKPYDRFGLVTGARNIVFAPMGHCAYLSLPNLSSSRSQPGRVLEFHVSTQGRIIYPPFASVPCGPMPTALAMDAKGRVAGVMDDETGFLWQYTVTAQGRLKPASPPSVAVTKTPLAPVIAQDGQFIYVIDDGRRDQHRIYQLHHQAGSFSLLMPWAVSLPGPIWDTAISNKHHVMYVSAGNRLLTFHISSQGTLRLGYFSMNTIVGVTMVVDNETDCLYVLGLHNRLRTYRICEDGTLKAFSNASTATNTTMSSFVVVHR